MLEKGDIISFLKQKDYELIDPDLGRGSFGKTVLLKDPYIDELFVAKKYAPEFDSMREQFYGSFLKEIKIMYKLSHKNIVRIFNYYAYEQYYTGYIIMEYVSGKNLFEYFNDYIPWENTDAPDKIFVQLVSAFDYMEKHSIVHRDIREGNILIDQDDNAKIIDFGLGKIFKPVDPETDSMVNIINRSGLDRLPEEYFTGSYDSKTDMFYLAELYNRVLNSTGCKSFFSYPDIVNRMMEKSPNERYKSFEDVLDSIGKKDFMAMEISNQDREIYQAFSGVLYDHIIEYLSEKEFNNNVEVFISRLEECHKKNCFENYLQNNGDLISAIALCELRYYTNKDISTKLLSDFIKWFKSLTHDSQQLVLNNMIYKLSGIEVNIPDDYIPF